MQRMGEGQRVRLLLAILIPWFLFFTIKRPVAGFVCLALQITLVGWLPAMIWAIYALGQFKTDKKIATAMRSERGQENTADGTAAEFDSGAGDAEQETGEDPPDPDDTADPGER